ncbi:MAG: Gfo/Idh/MocA family oxidoreductase [Vampirovibrionales bacterium]|nr:Gfo/Idh/MocA family oxidoreductase [Vampirovibrionales bacterium]
MLSVAVVGCGYWGPNLVRNFAEHPRVDLRAICDQSPERMTRLARRYPTARAVTDYAELLNDPTLDAIAIATPVHTHYALASQALQAGKHVLVEKPMCMTAAECLALIALADEKGLTLMVDHTFVYHGAVRRMKQLIESGDLGDILYFDSVRVNLGLFQSDINVVWDLAPHDLSIMDYLLGQTPHTLHASGACHTGSGLEDVAYLTLNFERNLIAHFHVSWLSPVKLRQMLIGGARKMIAYDDLQPMEKIRVYDKGIDLRAPSQSDEERYQTLVKYRLGDMTSPALDLTEALRVEIDHFAACVLDRQTPITDGRAGLRVVQMLEAANRSLASGLPQSLEAARV